MARMIMLILLLELLSQCTTSETSLRIYTEDYNPPFVTSVKEPDGSTKSFGAGIEMLDWIAAYSRQSCNVTGVVSVADFFKAFFAHKASNNLTNGMFGNLKLSDLDLLLFFHGVSAHFTKTMDTTVTEKGELLMIIPYPQEGSKLWAFANPFALQMWVCLVVAIIVVSGITAIINKLQTRGNETFRDPVMYVIRVMLGQACSNRVHYRLIALGWCLSSLILSNVYLSLLVTCFAAPYRVPVAQNLQEMVINDVIPVFQRYSLHLDKFQTSSSGSLMHQIYEKSNNRTNCGNNVTECLEIASREQKAAMFVVMIQKHKRKTFGDIDSYPIDTAGDPVEGLEVAGKCAFTRITLTEGPLLWGCPYLMPKGYPHYKNVSLGMLRSMEYGINLQMRLRQRNKTNACKCCNWKNDRLPLSPLGLKDIVSAFIILGICYSSAVLILLIEMIFFRYVKLKLT